MPELKFTCRKCKLPKSRIVTYMDPKLFTNPEKAVIKSLFWCSDCNKNTGLEYQCVAPNKVVLVGQFEPSVNPKVRQETIIDFNKDDILELDTVVSEVVEDIETVD